jgi:REP element-mobilizing transposase RayT
MPDHVHLVLAPAAACDGVTFVGQFKNLAQRAAWAHGVAGAFWQRSFWDRLVRVGEPLEPLVEYVLSNPVRAGLVQTWSEYPDAGSLTWEL